ncbi:phosphohistidine phosphatase SixA [Alteromonas gilva]|uniref:Phosphohistidine phosphatase SixA n=1 Tax=Alteromonas gilva TaxID=2987522 RepID=A0ABT5L3G6_9ALTE|nr:phosphohistidine phosphatase SixA [Alteromonas gilva]MDC8831571.1 phosphohistidine phosphatase SixA [Alteromonas gilva]
MSGQSSKDDIFIFIMRHGEAESLLINDKDRQLTSQGCAEISLSCNWLTSSYCHDRQLATVLVSPYKRTRQSYQELAGILQASHFEICSDITPDGNVKLAHDYIDVLAQQSLQSAAGRPLLVVSHMPFVSFLLDELCSTEQMSLFSTGSVAVVRYSVSQRKGVLEQHFQGR